MVLAAPGTNDCILLSDRTEVEAEAESKKISSGADFTPSLGVC
jgi:hypothetical protein